MSVLTVDEVLPALPGMPAKGPAVTTQLSPAEQYPEVLEESLSTSEKRWL